MTNITALVRTEQRLKDSERRFRTLAENSPDIIARVDRDMRVLYVNKPIEEAFGIPPEEFVGRTLDEIGRARGLVCPLDRRRSSGSSGQRQTDRFDFDSPGPQGVRHYNATVVPEFEEDGTLNTVLVTIRDITDRVHAEEKYSTVIRSLQDGFCILDPEGHYLEVNEAYSRMLGVDREELLQLTVWDVLAPDLHQELADHVQRALEQGGTSSESATAQGRQRRRLRRHEPEAQRRPPLRLRPRHHRAAITPNSSGSRPCSGSSSSPRPPTTGSGTGT